MIRRRLAGAALCGLALALGGCAVAAIPLVAGGAIVAGRDGDDNEEDNAAGDSAANDLARPRFEGPAAGATVPRATPTPMATLATPEANTPPLAGASETAIDEAEASLAVEASADPAAGERFPQGIDKTRYDAFYGYASAQARRDPVDQPRSSAVLASPGSLEPITTDCAIRPPAVLVDLDPGDTTLAVDALAPDPALEQALSALRVQDVAVFWISGASAGEAGALRARLRETGLDPWGRDGLLLMRRPDDRKQIRRKELSETHCVVAIAGDDRTDFDELFAYLKNPDAAGDLEPMFGKGWFLTSAAPITKED